MWSTINVSHSGTPESQVGDGEHEVQGTTYARVHGSLQIMGSAWGSPSALSPLAPTDVVYALALAATIDIICALVLRHHRLCPRPQRYQRCFVNIASLDAIHALALDATTNTTR